MKLPVATDPFEYKEYVLNLNKFASMTETPDNQDKSQYRTKRIIRSTQTIRGFEVNERGVMARAQWEQLSNEDRTKFLQA